MQGWEVLIDPGPDWLVVVANSEVCLRQKIVELADTGGQLAPEQLYRTVREAAGTDWLARPRVLLATDPEITQENKQALCSAIIGWAQEIFFADRFQLACAAIEPISNSQQRLVVGYLLGNRCFVGTFFRGQIIGRRRLADPDGPQAVA